MPMLKLITAFQNLSLFFIVLYVETLTLNRPSSDNIVSLTSSSSVASSSASLAAVEADSEPPPPVPSDPPPGEDDEEAESVASESSGAKRLSNVDVIHI